jgi:hypothetical protein
MRHTATALPMVRLVKENLLHSLHHETTLGPDGLIWTHGSGRAAEDANLQHGSFDYVKTESTSTDAGQLTKTISYSMPTGRIVDVDIDVVVRPDSTPQTSNLWSFRAHAQRWPAELHPTPGPGAHLRFHGHQRHGGG